MNTTSLKVKKTRSFWQRARGLLYTKNFPQDFDGLYIEPCSAVHTLGMHYDIDLLFLDRHLRILKVVEDVSPRHFCITCNGAYGVVELDAGKAQNFRKGQKITLEYL